ncbi:radical SAM protein, partial [Selenomonadales bacterium OttesenSCG-928-I06]|nr:radical SAM protein [Selenomonadales bacterium OttesenSCG-928-I06]
MRVSGILNESIVDGPGIRTVIFAQGCSHDCFGCQNPDTHDMNGGQEISLDKIYEKVRSIVAENKTLSGVTFSGGDPFFQSRDFAELGKRLKRLNLSVVTYTGFTFEQLLDKSEADEDIKKFLEITDILVDGRY